MTMDWLWVAELPVETITTYIVTKKRKRLHGIRRRGTRSSSMRKMKMAIVWKSNPWIWIPGDLHIVKPGLLKFEETLVQPMEPSSGLIFASRFPAGF